jgi:hypothetical protein
MAYKTLEELRRALANVDAAVKTAVMHGNLKKVMARWQGIVVSYA